MNEDYHLGLKDFIPVKGILNYQRRNSLSLSEALIDLRNWTLAVYNGVLVTGVAIIIRDGLETLTK